MAVKEIRSRLRLVPRRPDEAVRPVALVSELHRMDGRAERAGVGSLVSRVDETDGPADLAEADRLIADLEALVRAGLVVVQPNVLGPARYGVAPERGDAA